MDFKEERNDDTNQAVVLMRRTRAYFIKARTQLWSTERPDI